MSKIVTLRGDTSSLASNAGLVEMLEELTERARSGQIVALAAAFVKADGSVATRWEGGDVTIPMVAAISILQHEFLTGVGGGQ